MHTIGSNLGKALINKELGYAIIYAKTVLPWSLDCKFNSGDEIKDDRAMICYFKKMMVG